MTEERTREQVAKHALLTVNGGETKDMAEATGIRYTDRKSGATFDYMVPGATAGSPITMLAVFGAKTKATNDASALRQQGEDGAAQVAGIKEAFESISNGIWREKAERGPRIDRDALAMVLTEFLESRGIAKGDVLFYRQRLEDEVGYAAACLRNDEVEKRYREAKGKKPTPVEDLA